MAIIDPEAQSKVSQGKRLRAALKRARAKKGAAKPKADAPSIYERRLTEATERLERATVWLVIVAVISACIGVLQWREIVSGGADTHALAEAAGKQAEASHQLAQNSASQSSLMSQQLHEMQRSADAAVATSTANRAWLFVAYDAPQMPKIDRNIGTISFTIRNEGRTPATITSLETHLYMNKEWPAGGVPNPEVLHPPFIRETRQSPAINKDGTFVYEDDFGSRPTISAASAIRNIKIAFVYVDQTLQFGDAHCAYFYCVVRYKDIYNVDRKTSYFVQISGAGAIYPSDSILDRRLNSWN